jgi:hypothetical protein
LLSTIVFLREIGGEITQPYIIEIRYDILKQTSNSVFGQSLTDMNIVPEKFYVDI